MELIPGTWMDAFEAGQRRHQRRRRQRMVHRASCAPTAKAVTINAFWSHSSPQTVTSAVVPHAGIPEGDQVNDVRADLTFTHTRSCDGLTIEVTAKRLPATAWQLHVDAYVPATDACGSSTSATQTITVEDTTAPEFTSVPADYTVECSDAMPMNDASASDNCGDVSITATRPSLATLLATTRSSAFTATDAVAVPFCSQTITVKDTTAPD